MLDSFAICTVCTNKFTFGQLKFLSVQGHEFKERIQTFMATHPKKENILAFYKEKNGKEFCDSLLSACRAKYPHYMEEIKGIADGADIPHQQVGAVLVGLWRSHPVRDCVLIVLS